MKDLVAVPQVRSEVSPARSERSGQTFLWLAEAEKWEREAEAESLLSSKHAMPCERPLQSSQSPQNLVHAPEGGATDDTLEYMASRDHTHLDEPADLFDQYRGEVEAAASAKYDKGHEPGQAVIVTLNDL